MDNEKRALMEKAMEHSADAMRIAAGGAESREDKVMILGHITAARLFLEKCVVEE